MRNFIAAWNRQSFFSEVRENKIDWVHTYVSDSRLPGELANPGVRATDDPIQTSRYAANILDVSRPIRVIPRIERHCNIPENR